MKLDKKRFIQNLEKWHESHLDYYANHNREWEVGNGFDEYNVGRELKR